MERMEMAKGRSASRKEEVTGDSARMVVARVPTGFDANIHVRIVPGRKVDLGSMLHGCQPRQGAPRRDMQPLPLPGNLGGKLGDFDRGIIEWLARDEGNARAFVANPVASLKRAGIELSRAEEKALLRLHGPAREEMVLPPGVRLVDFKVSVNPSGRVGMTRPPSRDPRAGSPGDKDDCGCNSKRKA